MRGIVLDNPEYEVDEKKGTYKRKPRIYVLSKFFELYEVPWENEPLPQILEEVKFKDGKEITPDDLTSVARANLEEAIKRMIEKRKAEILEYINNPPQISIRMNSIELLPGVGKRTAKKILENRPYEDIPEKLKESITKRIIQELNKEDRYRLFVGPKSYINYIWRKKFKK